MPHIYERSDNELFDKGMNVKPEEITNRVLEKLENVKLEYSRMDQIGRFTLSFRVCPPFSHRIRIIEDGKVLHYVSSEGQYKGEYDWTPRLVEFELLVYYFIFLRSLCQVDNYPSKETMEKLLKAIQGRIGEVNTIEVCRILYGELWEDFLAVLKTYTESLCKTQEMAKKPNKLPRRLANRILSVLEALCRRLFFLFNTRLHHAQSHLINVLLIRDTYKERNLYFF